MQEELPGEALSCRFSLCRSPQGLNPTAQFPLLCSSPLAWLLRAATPLISKNNEWMQQGGKGGGKSHNFSQEGALWDGGGGSKSPHFYHNKELPGKV